MKDSSVSSFFYFLSFLFVLVLITRHNEIEKREEGEGKTIKFYIWVMSRKEIFYGWTFSFAYWDFFFFFFRVVNAMERESEEKNRKKKRRRRKGEISTATAPIAFFL